MLTVSSAVDHIFKKKPILRVFLAKNLANYSAVARSFKPEVEKITKKKVTTGAIMMALKRKSKKIKAKLPDSSIFRPYNLTVRSSLIEYTYHNSPSIGTCQKKLVESVNGEKDIFLHLAKGMNETTIITNQSMKEKIERIFFGEKLIAKLSNLSSISIKHPKQVVKTPGSYYSILQIIAFEGINLVEVTSTYTELTLVFYDKDIDKAFSAISQFLKN